LAYKASPLPSSAANGAKVLVILVVEDEFFVRYDIANFLREAGHRVIESASGEHAIMMSQSATAIDMVFTDINLGGSANGFDVAECFRQERPDIAVLYLSGERIDPARCVSGSMFVAKPFQQSDILSACQQLSRR
jgi:CheY-like chemotaxis protein